MMTKLVEMPKLISVPETAGRKYLTREVPGKDLEVDLSDEVDTSDTMDTPVLVSRPNDRPAINLVCYDRRYLSIAGGIHGVAVHTGNFNFLTQRNLDFTFNSVELFKFLRDEILGNAWCKNPFRLKEEDSSSGVTFSLEIPYEVINQDEYNLAVALGQYLNLWSRIKHFPRNKEYNVIKSELMSMYLAKGLVQLPKSKNRHVTTFIDALIEYTVRPKYNFLIINSNS